MLSPCGEILPVQGKSETFLLVLNFFSSFKVKTLKGEVAGGDKNSVDGRSKREGKMRGPSFCCSTSEL